jgi:iron complex transport system permease protein
MKIVLDLTKLVAEGKLTAAQAEELQSLARPSTGLLAINILMAFGVFAIAGGCLALVPSVITAIALGVVLAGIGVAISLGVSAQWSLLGTAITIAGALIASAGIVALSEGQWFGFAIATVVLLGLAVAIRSALLSALSVPALAGMLGSSTGYDFATYFVGVQEPAITIAVFSLLALAAYLISLRVPAGYEPLALGFSRLSLVMVNFGFWIGSLWGDKPGHSWRTSSDTWSLNIPEYVFVIGWAIALVGVGVWAARANRRFVVNIVATFGAIHFYTQWFERLGADPLTVLGAGVLVVAIAVGLWRYNAIMGRAQAVA